MKEYQVQVDTVMSKLEKRMDWRYKWGTEFYKREFLVEEI